MSSLFIETEMQKGVVELSLNRAEIHNAFNDQLIEQLTNRFNQLSGDPSVRVVIISGQGRSFCAGADLKWMKKMVNYSFEENLADSQNLAGLFHAINNCQKPVIAKVAGAAIGGGVGIVAAADFVIAAEHVKMAFAEVRLGIIPAVIAPFVIGKIGMSSARAYFLSGARFDANRAMQMGLVHRVTTAEQLDGAVLEQVQEYLQAGPQAVMAAKDLVKQVCSLEQEQAHQYCYQQIAKLRVSDEGQEGMSALLEKRKPYWKE